MSRACEVTWKRCKGAKKKSVFAKERRLALAVFFCVIFQIFITRGIMSALLRAVTGEGVVHCLEIGTRAKRFVNPSSAATALLQQ